MNRRRQGHPRGATLGSLVGMLALLTACSDGATTSGAGGSAGAGSSGSAGEGGGGIMNGGCPPGTKPDGDGACLEPGIPEGACGPGFSWVDGGCEPILPATPCPAGQLALPGETACHPLVDCGAAPWGDIPLEADTIYVDANFSGTSDGTETNPLTSIEAAVNMAGGGQLIAVAAGTYTEDIDVQKPVRIWGRCPDLVKVVGVPDEELSTIIVGTGAEGSELRNLSIEGPDVGLAFSGSQGVLFAHLWIHDTGPYGVYITRDLGETEYTIRHLLVEGMARTGISVFGADGVIEDTVVRDIASASDGDDGEGITVTENEEHPPDLAVRRSIIERSHDGGMLFSGRYMVFEDSVVRDIEPNQAEIARGRGIAIQYSPVHRLPAVAEVRRSYISDAHEYGVFVSSSEAEVEHVTVRQTHAPSTTRPIANGIAAIHAPDAPEGAKLTVRQSLFDRNEQTGVHVSGSEVTVEQVLIRDNLTLFGARFGRGMQVQKRAETGRPGNATIRWSAIHDCYESGILVTDSTASIEDTLITGILAGKSNGQAGDGIDAIFLGINPTEVNVARSLVKDSARVGLGIFGSSATLRDSTLDCNVIDINGESFTGESFDLSNLGGNHCGCGDEQQCKVLSASLGPPEVVADP